MCSDVRNKVVKLLRRLCERPDEVSLYIEHRAEYIANLVDFCKSRVSEADGLDRHLKQLLASQDEEQLEEHLAEFQWAGLSLERGLEVRFEPGSGHDLTLIVDGNDVPAEVYTPHAALAPFHTWHDRVKTAFLQTVRSRFEYGLFPEAPPGGCTPPTQDAHQLGVFLAGVVDGVQPVGNERLHIYVGLSPGQLDASQACVLRVEDDRPSESIRCALRPNLGDSVPSMLEFCNEQFDCQVPKCRDVSGVTGQLATAIRDTINIVLGSRQCARLSVHVPKQSPLRSAADPAGLLKEALGTYNLWLGHFERGLLFHTLASGQSSFVFVALPLDDNTLTSTSSWHRVRVYLNGQMQRFAGSVVVCGTADRPEVIERTLGNGGYGVSWLSDKLVEKLVKKPHQLPASGGILAVMRRGSILPSDLEIAAFLGRPGVSIDSATSAATPVLDVSKQGAGVFAKHNRVKAVFLAKLDAEHCRISELTYAPSPQLEAGDQALYDSLSEKLHVTKTCRWNTTGATWDFTVAAANGTQEPG